MKNKIWFLGIGMLFLAVAVLLVGSHATSAAVTVPDQLGPPWYDNPAWLYRRPITITNDGGQLAWYQVLIRLDNSNFDFSQAKNDGSDIRFTYSDGNTDLSYWIESWDSTNHLAYVWVKVPNLMTGDNLIYLYYHNPVAISESSGTTTFDSFEDTWGQFTTGGLVQPEEIQILPQSDVINSPFTWSVISGIPHVTSGILSLAEGDGMKSTSTYLYNAMGMRARFNSGDGYEWAGFINGDNGPQTMIGDLPSNPDNLFLINYRSAIENILIPRLGGVDWHNSYHTYEVRWKLGQSMADVDHGAVSATSTQSLAVPNTYLPVTLYSYMGSNATLNVDWIYIRQYRDPQPTVAVGAEQGLVALAVESIDSPDPVRSKQLLTYQITLTNSSVINATGVLVTDTLPINVQLGKIDTSQGSCVPGMVILCNLNTIYADSTAWITINVTPTVDGEITNYAVIGSVGYELDLSDNQSVQVTRVDSIPPLVNWEKPVQNGGTYLGPPNLITLEASAIDNDQVAWVEYKLWDHVYEHWIIIGRDYSYPYQVQFDASLLTPNEEYQTFVYAADRAGNQSDPYKPLQRIFLGWRNGIFLPVIWK